MLKEIGFILFYLVSFFLVVGILELIFTGAMIAGMQMQEILTVLFFGAGFLVAIMLSRFNQDTFF